MQSVLSSAHFKIGLNRGCNGRNPHMGGGEGTATVHIVGDAESPTLFSA
jgi:hypothetical protein